MALTEKEIKKLARRKRIIFNWLRKEFGSFEYRLIAPHFSSDKRAKAAVLRTYLIGRVAVTPPLLNRKHPLLNAEIWNHVRNDMRYSLGHFYENHSTDWHDLTDSQWLQYWVVDDASKPYGFSLVMNDDLPASLVRSTVRAVNGALGVGGNVVPLMEIKDERYDALRVVSRNLKEWLDSTTLAANLKAVHKGYWERLIGFAWWTLETSDYAFRTRGRNPGAGAVSTTFTGEIDKDVLVDYLEKWDAYGFQNIATHSSFVYSEMSTALSARKFLFLASDLTFDKESLPPTQPLWNLLDVKYYVEALGNISDPFSAPQ